jgi:hypothetical protein
MAVGLKFQNGRTLKHRFSLSKIKTRQYISGERQ